MTEALRINMPADHLLTKQEVEIDIYLQEQKDRLIEAGCDFRLPERFSPLRAFYVVNDAPFKNGERSLESAAIIHSGGKLFSADTQGRLSEYTRYQRRLILPFVQSAVDTFVNESIGKGGN